jgi:replication fork clamp-binding protein CrfC
MWFCVKYRKIVEEHIIIDLNIEKRCKEIMENYEQRIRKE